MIEPKLSDLVREEDSNMKKFVISRLASLSVIAMSLMVLPVAFASSATAAELKVLVVNQGAVLQGSLAGKDQAAKLQAIFKTIETEERAEMKALGGKMKEVEGQKALLGDGFAQKQMELQRAAEIVRVKYEQERKYTQENAQRAIIQVLYPIFNALMQEHKGTLLLDQSQVIMASPDFNITEEALKRLDASLPTIEVKRITFAEIQKAFVEQQARVKAAQDAKK